MIIVAISAWIVFCIRDYGLIHAGSAGRLRQRATYYSLSVLGTSASAGLGLILAGPDRVRSVLHAPWVLGAAIGIHIFMMALAIGVERRGTRESFWRICLVPAPAPWILLTLICAGLMLHSNQTSPPLSILLIPVVWAWFVYLTIRAERYAMPSTQHPSFSVLFAAWANSMACCLVPLIAQ